MLFTKFSFFTNCRHKPLLTMTQLTDMLADITRDVTVKNSKQSIAKKLKHVGF